MELCRTLNIDVEENIPSRALRFENRFDDSVIAGLQRMGHLAETIPDPASAMMGLAGGVTLYPDRSLGGAHDPRSDGGAAGL